MFLFKIYHTVDGEVPNIWECRNIDVEGFLLTHGAQALFFSVHWTLKYLFVWTNIYISINFDEKLE